MEACGFTAKQAWYCFLATHACRWTTHFNSSRSETDFSKPFLALLLHSVVEQYYTSQTNRRHRDRGSWEEITPINNIEEVYPLGFARDTNYFVLDCRTEYRSGEIFGPLIRRLVPSSSTEHGESTDPTLAWSMPTNPPFHKRWCYQGNYGLADDNSFQ